MSGPSKTHRQLALKNLISKNQLRTQQDLVDALIKEGFNVGQATISRDIQEMGVMRMGGVYRLGEGLGRSMRWTELLSHPNLKIARSGDNIVVVRIGLGEAPLLAAEIDQLDWPEIVGTIAGDDTLFIAVANSTAQKQIIQRLHDVVSR